MALLAVAICLGGVYALWRIYQKLNSPSPIDWSKECLLITGGAQGIGADVVDIATKKGCQRIVIVDVKEPVYKLPSNATFYKCDISDFNNIAQLKNTLDQENINPTLLVNNAGIWNGGKRIGELTKIEIERVVQVNMMAPFWLTREFLPFMLQKGHGRIVNVSSVLGMGGVAKMTDYCASKFGLFGMTESLRLELKADGFKDVIATVVCPFHVGTTLFANKVKWDHRWLMSTLEPRYVASRIVGAMERGEEEVWLPSSLLIIPALRVLPTRIYDLVHKILGSDDSIIVNQKSK